MKNDFHQFELDFTKEKEMADFRKWFLVLAVLALVVVPASAQTPFTCTATPGSTPTIRDAGLTELVGDVVLTCSGGDPSAPPITTNFQIFMSPTQVTNKVKAGTPAECPTGIPCVTDALAIITNEQGEPVLQTSHPNPGAGIVVGLLQSNLAAGDAPNTRNSILFPAITLPQGSTSFIRITNVRVVAPPVSNIAIPTQVFEFVSTNPAGVVPIANSTLVVAFVQPGLQFAARDASDNAPANLSFTQCNAEPRDEDPGYDFIAKFTEGFPLAFKTQAQETGRVPAPLAAAIGGTVMPDPTASDGTLLTVRFSNIPAGVQIFVTSGPVSPGTSVGINATLITPAQVSISNGSGQATWRITENDPTASSAQKSIAFGIDIVFTPNTSAGLPGLTGTNPGSVAGLFSPVSTVDFASTTAAIPRFRDDPRNASVFTIVPCVTNLLFPFLTSQAGFNTGIALVNTSLDNAGNNQPFDTDTQSGTCTVYYFSVDENGTDVSPAPQETRPIPAGNMVAFNVPANFQGYAIARCNFQFAHGFAFISDVEGGLGSQGYLALVIPDRADGLRLPQPFTQSVGNTGEQLGM